MEKGVRRALAISLALHATLLWQVLASTSGVRSQLQTSPRPEALSAVLHSATEAPPLQAPIHLSKPQQRSPKVMPVITQSTVAMPTMATTAPFAPPLKAPPIPTDEPRTVLSPVSASSSSESAAVDANGLRQYRVSLAVAARRFRNFPAQALANGLNGTVEVRVSIAANGSPQPPQLERSSGHDLLDTAALQMIGNALQNTRLPESLHGQSFSLRLPVEFRGSEE